MHHSISIILLLLRSRDGGGVRVIKYERTQQEKLLSRPEVSSNLWGTIGREKERVQPVRSFTFAPLGHTVFSSLPCQIDTRNSFPLRHEIIDFLSDGKRPPACIPINRIPPRNREKADRQRDGLRFATQGCGSIIEITKRE